MPRFYILAITLIFSMNANTSNAASWDENVNGDLSNNGLSPSTITLTQGNNLVSGAFGAPDLDYLAVTVPPGHVLTGIITGVHTIVGLSRSFIGVQSGNVMTVPPTASGAAGLLGWTHFGGADGVNLLPAMGVASFGSTGFTPPLSAGTYTFWINEVSSDPGLTFDFNFQVQAVATPVAASVPLPLWSLLALGGFLLGFTRIHKGLVKQ